MDVIDIVLGGNRALEGSSGGAASQVVGTEIGAKSHKFAALMNNTDKVESFVFFTDPHLAEASGYEKPMLQYMNSLANYYYATPTSFVLCGGDWIGNMDTQAEACFKLGRIDGLMKQLFDRYYMVVGNHDTNYQGRLNEEAERYSGTFTNETIRNLWLRGEEKLYYSFKGANTQFYVLETGSDFAPGMTDYRWEQVAWLGDRLKNDDAPYSALALHIGDSPLAQNIYSLCNAYNQATSITLNGASYDFTGCTGKVKFALAGHTHEDSVAVTNGIIVVTTTHMRKDGTPTFDLCIADYDNDVLYMKRVGSGLDRRASLVDGRVEHGDYDVGEVTFLPRCNHNGGGINYYDRALRSIAVSSADTGVAYAVGTGTTDITHYALPIPDGATKIRVFCPDNERFSIHEIKTDGTTGDGDNGWMESGTEYVFTGKYNYYLVQLRKEPETAYTANHDYSGHKFILS